jgi:hypothetical protein
VGDALGLLEGATVGFVVGRCEGDAVGAWVGLEGAVGVGSTQKPDPVRC